MTDRFRATGIDVQERRVLLQCGTRRVVIEDPAPGDRSYRVVLLGDAGRPSEVYLPLTIDAAYRVAYLLVHSLPVPPDFCGPMGAVVTRSALMVAAEHLRHLQKLYQRPPEEATDADRAFIKSLHLVAEALAVGAGEQAPKRQRLEIVSVIGEARLAELRRRGYRVIAEEEACAPTRPDRTGVAP